jgi:pimeloyl-ACP methyl ester carboxylesterase
VAWLHFIDAAAIHPQRNASPIEHTLQFLLAIAAGPVFAWLYLKTSRSLRAGGTLIAGMPLLWAGAGIHIVGTIKNGYGSGDATGIAMAFAGLGLVLLGFSKFVALPRRWRFRLLVLPAFIPLFLYVLLPGGMVTYISHAPRYQIDPQDLGAAYESVEFQAEDGVTLKGWYIPSQNGAAVAVIHGSGGARIRPLEHIRMLQRNGYGVLAFDVRGHGESGGSGDALGMEGYKDAMAALAFMEARDDVEPGRVGLLGLSMGAEIALDAAVHGARPGAIVSDGAGERSIREYHTLKGSFEKTLAYPAIAVQSYGSALLTGNKIPPPQASRIEKVVSPVFYISGNVWTERELNGEWNEKTTATHELWEVDAGHTSGLKTHPEEYERRVITWFDTYLLQQVR